MTTQAYWNWRNAGSLWSPATPIADFRATMQGHGCTVYVLGADDPSHLRSDFPEDHCPFSQTPWPGAQPYPRVLALDIMPGGEMDWQALGEKIVADKNAGVPGTEWIKYLNYTDRNGDVWHASWQPTYSRRASSDGGHIHISARTDYVDAHTAYDPINGGDDDMSTQAENILWAAAVGLPRFVGNDGKTYPNVLWQWQIDNSQRIDKVAAAVAADEVRDKAMAATIDGLVAGIKAGGGSVDAAPIVAAVNAVRDEARAEYAKLHAENAELRARLQAAGVALGAK